VPASWSDVELLRRKDFAQYTTNEMALARELIERLDPADGTLARDRERLAAVRAARAAAAQAYFGRHAAEWDRTETIDRGIVSKLAELGFLAAALPEEHGGLGLDMVSYALVVEEIGRADSKSRAARGRSPTPRRGCRPWRTG